jgi:hypothetical protein
MFSSINLNNAAVRSELLTLSTEGWSSEKLQKVLISIDVNKFNMIINTASEKEWATCSVRPILEEPDGITFECSKVPTEILNFYILSSSIIS